MSLASVNVYVKDDTTDSNPIPGVVVRIFDSTGTGFLMQAMTDVNGLAGFTLAAPATYQVRFFKEQCSIPQPQNMAVPDATSSSYTAVGHVYSPPEATHPRLCCCSGFFKRPDNSAAIGHLIHVIPKFDPILFEGSAMLTELLKRRTDESGYIQFNLVRFGQYEVTVEGFEDQIRIITVPDAPSVNLPDLIFPVVESISFDPPGPYTVLEGAENEITITPTVRTTDGRILPGVAIVDVQWSSTDPNVLAVLPTDKTIVLRGLSPGTAELQATRADYSIIRIPNPPIEGVPVGVTVL
jgi:hypothetical protein